MDKKSGVYTQWDFIQSEYHVFLIYRSQITHTYTYAHTHIHAYAHIPHDTGVYFRRRGRPVRRDRRGQYRVTMAKVYDMLIENNVILKLIIFLNKKTFKNSDLVKGSDNINSAEL